MRDDLAQPGELGGVDALLQAGVREARPVGVGRADGAVLDEPRVGGEQDGLRWGQLPNLSRPVTTLLIDNYDSYTFNLYQLIAGSPARSRSSSATTSCPGARWRAIAGTASSSRPAPAAPSASATSASAATRCARALVPVLGVCLGHQGLAHVRGAGVVRGADVVHGRISPVFHRGDALFAGIPQGFRAVRYHSLVVEPALPPDWRRSPGPRTAR